MKLRPEEDGITHINVYSRGKTELGCLLSNFARTPFICEDGDFSSIEGYWYWLNCNHPDKDILRRTFGYEAKEMGRLFRAQDWNEDLDFKDKIIKALQCKLEQTDGLRSMLAGSYLPFVHYYVYNNRVYDHTKKTQWMLDFWNNQMRSTDLRGDV